MDDSTTPYLEYVDGTVGDLLPMLFNIFCLLILVFMALRIMFPPESWRTTSRSGHGYGRTATPTRQPHGDDFSLASRCRGCTNPPDTFEAMPWQAYGKLCVTCYLAGEQDVKRSPDRPG